MNTKKTILTLSLLLFALSACFSFDPKELKRNEYHLMDYSEYLELPDYVSSNWKTYINEYGFRQLDEFDGDDWFNYCLIDGVADYMCIYENSFKDHDIDFTYKTLEEYKRESSRSLNHQRLAFAKNFACSSFLQEGKYSYELKNVFIPCKADYGLTWVQNLPWVEGKADDGIGEWIQFDIQDPNEWKDIMPDLIIDGDVTISILNGYVHPEKQYLFYDNNRVKKATVYLDGVESFDIDFADCVEFTEFTIPNTVKTVRLVIKEVYKGKKYSDTCITKIDVDYKTRNDPNSAKNSEL